MIGASKILTVSYGTFSCTLEGFDDPFNTMRAIAEYFRDLAAEDRYFGAEPPTPDAAMLHRIAEREINRRVEANIQENGVILRAGDIVLPNPQHAMTAPAVAPAAVAASFAPAEPAPAAPGQPEDDSVAARLTRLREAQAASDRLAAERNVADHATLDATPSQDEDDTQAQAAPPPAIMQTDVWDMAEHAAPAQHEDDTEAQVTPQPAMMQADVWDAALAEDTIASVMADLATPQPEPLSGGVPYDALSNADAPAAILPADTVDGDVWPLVADAAVAADDAVQDMAAIADAEPAHAEPATDVTADLIAEPAGLTADDAILRATLGQMIDPEGDEDDVVALGQTAAPAYADPAGASAVAEVPAVADAIAELPTEAGVAPEAPAGDAYPAKATEELAQAGLGEPLVSTSAETRDADVAPVIDAAAPADGRAAERLQRARARVIKIRRIDVAAGASPTAEPEQEPATAPPPAPSADQSAAPSALSPEAEAELQRELADLEADLAPVAEPASTAARPQAFTLPEPHKPADPTPADDSVTRLISQTNAAMEGPENKRRLAAIAHLKAAVAATFADRKANATPAQPGPAERQDPYREDLDRVVRPRRPSLVTPGAPDATAAAGRSQMDTRPAPLVLVSEQRIDRAAAKPHAAPVRPRRVTTDFAIPDQTRHDKDRLDSDDDDGGFLTADDVNNIFADPTQPFAEFAERLGAVTMPDLMEAAAAYCALQLGRDQFTRPLLLQQISDLPGGDDFNREDCLRGFGTLLRDGRIEKIKRGQFKLSGQSRYLAEAKRLAG